MIKVTYRIPFGLGKEYTATLDNLETPEDLIKIIREHASSKQASFWSTKVPEARIEFCKGGVIHPFSFFRAAEILEYLKNPEDNWNKDLTFPIQLSDELLERKEAISVQG